MEETWRNLIFKHKLFFLSAGLDSDTHKNVKLEASKYKLCFGV